MMKQKRMALSTLQLAYHPMTLSLISADQFGCEQLPDLSSLSTVVLDTLLAQLLPVCATEIENHYVLLAPCPLFFLLRLHPNAP